MTSSLTRREFLAASALLTLAAATGCRTPRAGRAEPIIDIHQHTDYSGRTDAQLLAHQQTMGVTQTILLPAGRPVARPSTDGGRSNGLAAHCGGNQRCRALAGAHPRKFFFFANDVPDLPGARTEVVKYLRLGAIGIGEQKFHLDCDSPPLERIAEIAREFHVPVLLHFQHDAYNTRIENFHRILEKFPTVDFIGHAQTWWSSIDAQGDPAVLYPKGRVTPGGLTDRLLADYPNMFGDLSAGSGLNALTRDEEFTRGFLERHQDKLLYGSDCNDVFGRGAGCSGSQTIAAVRRLASSRTVERKLLYENAKKMFRL